MSQPYVGEIRMFAGNFNPAGWAFCDGQLIPISENDTLFNLIGTTYGGDGQQTFALPNLQARLPLHMGPGPGGPTFTIGETGGAETITLTTQQIPIHNHPLLATNGGPQASPAGANPAVANSPQQVGVMVYGAPAGNGTTLHPSTIQNDGSSNAHNNMQPYQCINFIISLFGIYPSPT
jgi:microcystin-dependent protein